jgi:hypothetical protein
MFLENKISRSLTTVGARYLSVSTVLFLFYFMRMQEATKNINDMTVSNQLTMEGGSVFFVGWWGGGGET